MNDLIDEFTLEEYKTLTNAHFQTSQKLTSFFQYALLIFSAPIVLLTVNLNNDLLLGAIFTIIGIVGLAVVLFLYQLRAESILYARNINKIRSEMYAKKKQSVSLDIINQYHVLLSQGRKPKYSDLSQFGLAELALGIFNTFYFSFGVFKLISWLNTSNSSHIQQFTSHPNFITLAIGIAFFTLQLLLYWIFTCYNENGSAYFKRIIGVDVDGVLNEHEMQFVDIYNKKNQLEKLTINEITTLPVSDSGIISREKNQAIFRVDEYWEMMPAKNGIYDYLIEEIKNKYGYKVFIFTWRDWKVTEDVNGNKIYYKIKNRTKKWLHENKISYDRIWFEKGNVDRPVSTMRESLKEKR